MRNILFIFILSLGLNACEMGINPKNYPFYCEIDGKKFVPERDRRIPEMIGSTPYQTSFPKNNGIYLSFFARNSPVEVTISLKIPEDGLSVGEYLLEDNEGVDSYAAYTPNNRDRSSRSRSQSGWVKIAEVENGKFRGEFEFTTYNEYLGRTVKVTNGKFRNKD